jgi:hypothetical protein
MLVAICVLMLAALAWRATSPQRLLLGSMLCYGVLMGGLLSGCVSARNSRWVMELDTVHRIGLPAEPVTAPPASVHRVGLAAEGIKAPRRLAKRKAAPDPATPTRRQRRQAIKAANYENKFVRQYLLAEVAASRPAKVKVKNSFNVDQRQELLDRSKTKTTAKDQSKAKPALTSAPAPAPRAAAPGGAAAAAPVGRRLVTGLAVVGGLASTAGILALLNFNPFSWLWSVVLAFFRRKDEGVK